MTVASTAKRAIGTVTRECVFIVNPYSCQYGSIEASAKPVKKSFLDDSYQHLSFNVINLTHGRRFYWVNASPRGVG